MIAHVKLAIDLAKLPIVEQNSISSKIGKIIGSYTSDTKKNNRNQELKIYKIECNECDKAYIGQTGRPFKIRFREHINTSENNVSAFGKHLRENKHSTESIEENLKILHIVSKGQLMDVLEELQIYTHMTKYPEQMLNEQTEMHNKKFIENFHNTLASI